MTGSAQKTTLDNAALNALDKEVTHIRYKFLRHQLTLSLEQPSASIALSPNGKVLVTGGREDGTIKIWNTQTGQIVNSWLAGPLSPYPGKNQILSLAISGDGATLVTGGRFLKQWELETGKQVRIFKGSTSWTSYTIISADSSILVTENWGGIEAKMIVWDLKRGKKIRTKIGTISVLWVISLDSSMVVGEDNFDKSIKVWNLKTGEMIRALDTSGAIRVHKLAFSPDGKLLAGGGSDGIRIWNFNTGQQIQTIDKFKNIRFHEHLDTVFSLIFSYDGKTLLTSGRDGLIQFWDITTGKNVGTLEGQYRVGFIAMSNDNHTLVGFGGNNQNEQFIEIWRVF